MALDFSGSNAARVDHGNLAAFTNLGTGTILTWCRPASFSTGRRILQKQTGQGFFLFWCTNAPGIEFTVNRATDALSVSAAVSDMPALATDSECFLAAQWNVNGTISDQKLLAGNATTLAAEAGAYVQHTPGAGTQGDNSAANLIVGNTPAFTQAFDGAISWVGIWNRQLTLAEIHEQQLCPHPTEGCVLFSHYLVPSGDQIDESATRADGTPTSTTYASRHAPYEFPDDGTVPQHTPGVQGSTIVSASLSDTLAFSDTLTQDTSIIRNQDEGDQTATFSDALFTTVTEGDGVGGGLTINATITDIFTFTESFNRNPSVDRVLVG